MNRIINQIMNQIMNQLKDQIMNQLMNPIMNRLKKLIKNQKKNQLKHTSNTFQKKIVLIPKNKIKVKSRCAICLTENYFIGEIQYDLENPLEIYLQFLFD